jgi:hypothetical protein
MSTIAARNVAGVLNGYKVWESQDMLLFLGDDPPSAIPSLVGM